MEIRKEMEEEMEITFKNYTWYSALGRWREYGPMLADGVFPYKVWFTPGVASYYDKNGDFYGKCEEKVPKNAVAVQE